MASDCIFGNNVIMVSGPKHCGKTTLVEKFVAFAAGQGLRMAGILAKGLWKDNLRTGFDLINLSSGYRTPLARRRDQLHPQHRLIFDFLADGMQAGLEALSLDACRPADIVVVDEVGRLEARGQGWAPCLSTLLTLDKPLIILVVRLNCIQRIGDLFAIPGAPVIDAGKSGAFDQLFDAAQRILPSRLGFPHP